MKTKRLMVGCAVGALMAGTTAWAGLKNTYEVFVSLEGRAAAGSVGDARGSADPNQYIGCAVATYEDGTSYVHCEAHLANEVAGYCYSTSPAMVATAAAQSSDSYFYFAWDEQGVCTVLYVTNASNLTPRQP